MRLSMSNTHCVWFFSRRRNASGYPLVRKVLKAHVEVAAGLAVHIYHKYFTMWE